MVMAKKKLTLFDLDHTLLTGDSDVLWCDFLIRRGLLDRAEFSARKFDKEIEVGEVKAALADIIGETLSPVALPLKIVKPENGPFVSAFGMVAKNGLALAFFFSAGVCGPICSEASV